MKNRFLFLFIFLFLGLRLAALLTAVEEVAWFEELHNGVLAKEWLKDWKLPLWEFQAGYYHGGSLLTGILATPLFFFLGPSLFALKLVPLSFSLATMILLYLFLNRFFNLKVAFWATLLFILPPPVFSKLSLYAVGYHPESNLFSVTMLFCLYQFLYGQSHRRFSLVFFGISAGLGFWFDYITLIAFATCMVTWFFVDRKSLFSRSLLLPTIGFLIGLIPWLAYNFTYRFVGLDVLQFSFFQSHEVAGPFQRFTEIIGRMGRLLLYSIPRSFSFPPCFFVTGGLISYLYYFIILSLVIPFVRIFVRTVKVFQKEDGSKRTALPFILYPVFFLLAYSITLYPIQTQFDAVPSDFRYFSTLFFFACPLIALAGDQRRNRWAFFIPLVLLGMIGQGALLFKEPFGRAVSYKGYAYGYQAIAWNRLGYSFPERIDKTLSLARRLSEPERRSLYRSLALSGIPKDYADADFQRSISWISQVPPKYQGFFFEILGQVFGGQIFAGKYGESVVSFVNKLPAEGRKSFSRGITSAFVGRHGIEDLHYLNSHPEWVLPKEKKYIYFDLGRLIGSLGYLPENQAFAIVDLFETLPLEERIWIYRGLGRTVNPYRSTNLWRTRSFERYLEAAPADRKSDFFWGVGWNAGEKLSEDRIRTMDSVTWLPKEFQRHVMEGMRARLNEQSLL